MARYGRAVSLRSVLRLGKNGASWEPRPDMFGNGRNAARFRCNRNSSRLPASGGGKRVASMHREVRDAGRSRQMPEVLVFEIGNRPGEPDARSGF